MKYLLIVFLGLVMTACSGNYKVKQEASKNNDMDERSSEVVCS